MKRCGLYVRVSTERQALIQDGSLDTQIDTLRKYVDIKSSTTDDSWTVAEIYREEGRSGKDTNRPEYQRMVSDIRAKHLDVLLCVKIDRISRSLMDFYQLHELLELHGITFVSLHENWDTSSPMGRFGLKLTLAVAELEREQTGERVREKMEWRAGEGLWNGGQILGYDLDPDQKGILVPNFREASIIRFIFETYLETASLRETARRANSAGYRGKTFHSRRDKLHQGKPFTKTDVVRILRNPVYIGKIRQKGQLHPGKHKGIVPMRLWQLAESKLPKSLKGHRKHGRKGAYMYKLKGLLRCGHCGGHMTVGSGTGRNGVHRYYQCTRLYDGSNRCKMKMIPASAIENLVACRLKELNGNRALIRDILASADADLVKTMQAMESQREEAHRQVSMIEDRLKKIIDFIGKGQVTATLRQELNALEDRKTALGEELSTLEAKLREGKAQQFDPRVFKQSLKLFDKLWDKATEVERIEILRLQVSTIVYKPDLIKIGYYPILGSLTRSSGIDPAKISSFQVWKAKVGSPGDTPPVRRNGTDGGPCRT